jgi:putative membrane protein
MKANLKRIIVASTLCLPTVTLVIWIATYSWLLKGDRYKAFLQPKLWPLLILAMVLLLIFVAAYIFQFQREKKALHIPDVWLQAAILIVPAIFLWTVYGQSLGSHALTQKSLDLDAIDSLDSQLQTPLEDASGPDSEIMRASLLDLIKNSEKFEGKLVATEGMVFNKAPVAANTFKIFRFAIVCCAADALPLRISVKSEQSRNFKNETWVRVEGKFKTNKINGRQVLSIDAQAVQEIPAPPPEEQYLFFY